MELAGSLARELQELKADLAVDTQELAESDEAYQANLRQAKVAQREFEDKVRRLEKQLSQVKVKEAQAEAASALSSVAFKVGDLGDTMKTVEEILQKRYEVSAGKARLAKDMVDMEAVTEKENERKTWELARAALERDRARDWQLASHAARLRILTIDALCTSLARQMPVLSRLGAAPAIVEDSADLFREAAERTLALVEKDEAVSPLARAVLNEINVGGRVSKKTQLAMEDVARLAEEAPV